MERIESIFKVEWKAYVNEVVNNNMFIEVRKIADLGPYLKNRRERIMITAQLPKLPKSEFAEQLTYENIQYPAGK